MEPLLHIHRIEKAFGGVETLRGASFALYPQTITTLLGPNGAGKSTLFNIISGFVRQDGHGEIRFAGTATHALSPADIARLGIGRAWQTPRIFKNISALDNLVMAAANHPGDTLRGYFFRPRQVWQTEKTLRARARETAKMVGIATVLAQPAGNLSFGQQKLLSIGMLLMYDVSLLLLDEPFAGLSPEMVQQVSAVLKRLRSEGKTILMIEHNQTQARAISDRMLVLNGGVITEEGKEVQHG